MKVNQFRKFTAPERRWLLLMLAAILMPFGYVWWQKNAERPKPQPLFSFEAGPKAMPTSVAFSPDSQWLACAFSIEKGRKINARGAVQIWAPGEVRIYDVRSGQLKQTLQCGTSVSQLAFSRDGKRLRAVEGKFVRWWNLRSGSVIRRLAVSGFAPAFSSDESWFAVARDIPKYQQRLDVCDGKTGRSLMTLGIAKRQFNHLSIARDDKKVIAVCDEDTQVVIRIYNLRTRKTNDVRKAFGLVGANEAAQGRIVFNQSGRIGILQHQTTTYLNSDGFINRAWPPGSSFSNDGWLVAVGGYKLKPQRWKRWRDWEYDSELDPDANFGRASVWNLRTQKQIFGYESGKRINTLALAGQGNYLAIGVEDSWTYDNIRHGHVELWPVPTM